MISENSRKFHRASVLLKIGFNNKILRYFNPSLTTISWFNTSKVQNA